MKIFLFDQKIGKRLFFLFLGRRKASLFFFFSFFFFFFFFFRCFVSVGVKRQEPLCFKFW